MLSVRLGKNLLLMLLEPFEPKQHWLEPFEPKQHWRVLLEPFGI
jgi:hypothetical protein